MQLPKCRMQMLLALDSPAWQLLTEHRCGRPLRQNKVEAANNVITQSLHIGVHSLWAAVDSGHCWHRLGKVRDVTGCQECNAHNLMSLVIQDSLNSTGLRMNVNERKRHRWCQKVFTKQAAHMFSVTGSRVGGSNWNGSGVWCKGQTCCFTLSLYVF